jgi:hypothetical protein
LIFSQSARRAHQVLLGIREVTQTLGIWRTLVPGDTDPNPHDDRCQSVPWTVLYEADRRNRASTLRADGAFIAYRRPCSPAGSHPHSGATSSCNMGAKGLDLVDGRARQSARRISSFSGAPHQRTSSSVPKSIMRSMT